MSSDAAKLVFGITLGFLAEFWCVYGNIQIKYSHKLDAIKTIHRPVFKRCRWWFGFSMYILNAIFKFSSYMFASINIIAPTASLSIIINVAMARWYFKEKLTLYGLLGSILIIVGCVLSIVFGTHNQDEITVDSLFKYAKTNKFIVFTTFHTTFCFIFGFVGAYLVSSAHKYRLRRNFVDRKIANGDHNDRNDRNVNIFNDDINKYEHHSNHNCNEEKKQEMDINASADVIVSINNNNNTNNHSPFLFNLQQSMNSLQSQITSKYSEFFAKENKKEFVHVLTCFLLAFTTAGVVAWVQMLGKISADLLWQSIFENNDQFTSLVPFVILILIVTLLCFELYLISEIMRLFDAVLIVPIYNSLYILTCIGLSAAYFQNFKQFALLNLLMFLLGLAVMFCGMVLLMSGQKHSSLQHQEIDTDLSRTNLIESLNQ